MFFIENGTFCTIAYPYILGVSDVIHWTKKEKVIEKDKNGKSIRDYDYKKLSLEERESHRWIKLSENTKTKFSHAKK